MFHLASWCFNFASINAVWTTSVWDGPLGAVIVELMPSWFTAMPRSAAWDWHAIIACRFPGPFIEKKSQVVSHLSIYPYVSHSSSKFSSVSYQVYQVWFANQLRSTLEPSHVHPVDDKASQHLCSRCARIDRLSLYSQGDIDNIDSKGATWTFSTAIAICWGIKSEWSAAWWKPSQNSQSRIFWNDLKGINLRNAHPGLAETHKGGRARHNLGKNTRDEVMNRKVGEKKKPTIGLRLSVDVSSWGGGVCSRAYGGTTSSTSKIHRSTVHSHLRI